MSRLLYWGIGSNPLTDRVGGEYGTGWTCPSCEALLGRPSSSSALGSYVSVPPAPGPTRVVRDVVEALKDGLSLKATRARDEFVVSVRYSSPNGGYIVKHSPSNGWQDGVTVHPGHLVDGAAQEFIREVGEEEAQRAVLNARRPPSAG
jgi:hypothetical protein